MSRWKLVDQLKLLKTLGFNEYESRAYLALAKLGPSSVREIVLESNLPRNKAYEALQVLETKNKVVSLPVSPKKYKILNPELLKEEVKDLNESIESFVKMVENPQVPEFKDLFWVIKGKKAIEERLSIENTRSKREILGCNNLSKHLYRNLKTMEEAIRRGVKVKMICQFNEERLAIYKEWLKIGVEIRVFNEKRFGPLLPRITIIDGQAARLTIGEPEVKKEEEYITLWTESKAFSQMLRNHFRSMWKECKPIKKAISKA